MVSVIKGFGTARTRPFSAAAKNPARSANPDPMMTTMTMPSGGNAVNTCGSSTNSRRICAASSRLTALTASPVAGLIADAPTAARTADSTMTMQMEMMKSETGSGSLFPATSMAFRIRRSRLGFSCAATSVIGHPWKARISADRSGTRPRRSKPRAQGFGAGSLVPMSCENFQRPSGCRVQTVR